MTDNYIDVTDGLANGAECVIENIDYRVENSTRPSYEAMLFTSGTECAIVPRVSCFLKRDKDTAQPRKFKQYFNCV